MRKQIRHLMLLTVAVIGASLLVSCSDSDDGSTIDDDSREWIYLDSEQREYVGFSNSFSENLWRAVNAAPEYTDKNFIISPLSLQINLALLANGASDETLKTLTDVLLPDCPNPSLDKLNELNSLLIEKLTQVDKKAKYKMANSVWYCKSIDLTEDYISRVGRYYDASIFQFERATVEAKNAINNWILSATEGSVKELLQSPPKDHVIFLSALLFKHVWMHKFETSDTELENFYCESGDVVKVPMMNKFDSRARIFTHQKSLRAAVPFGNGAFELHLIKPDEGYSVEEAIENLRLGEVYNRDIKLKLPRFSLETDIDFFKILCSMGLEDAFHATTSDYSYMTSKKLDVSFFHQKSKIEVDENGAEYKVVTSSGAVGDTAPGPPPAVVEFYLDHPFAFEIRELSTGIVIAAGKICNL